jgi:phosphoglycerate dehydrogenase-like enzyme
MTQFPDRPRFKLLVSHYHEFDLWRGPDWFAERLRKEFPQVEVGNLTADERAEEQIADAEVVVSWRLSHKAAIAAKKLRWLHSTSAAVHQLLYPEIVNSDIILTNGSEVHAAVVAEHVIALVFALAKKFPEAARFQQKRIWGQEDIWKAQPRPREIAGATLGLVGLGSIGREVVQRAVALGMRVIAVREHLEKGCPQGVAQVFAPSQLDALLRESDYVVLALPLTRDTKNLINAERLSRMKPDARLINVGRGAVVDEAALIEALRAGKIAGAGLDVFVEEPLPSDSPLWDLEHLLITPHTASDSEKQWDRQYALVAENLRRYLNHEPLRSVVDKQKGY